MPRNRIVLGAIVFLCLAQAALSCVPAPEVTVTYPEDGAVLRSGDVYLTGTASPTAVNWTHSTRSDFGNGTLDGTEAGPYGGLVLSGVPYDDFDDGLLDPLLWPRIVEAGPVTIDETGGMLRFNGTTFGNSWDSLSFVESSVLSGSRVTGDLASFSGSGNGYLTGIGLWRDDSHGMYVGLGKPAGPEVFQVVWGYSDGGALSREFLGNYSAGPHRLRVETYVGFTSVYMDDNFVIGIGVDLKNSRIRVFAQLAIHPDTITASWDNLSYDQCGTGNYTSEVKDAGTFSPEFGGVSMNASIPAGCWVTVHIRTGDAPDLSSAAWTEGEPPLKRYLQYRVQLNSNDRNLTPFLRSVTVKYLTPVSMVEVSLDNRTSWQPATGTSSWFLAVRLPENWTVIWIRATDHAGGVGLTSLTVGVDLVPPVGSMLINNGAAICDGMLVTLTLNATDNLGVANMILSEDPGFAGASWIPYASNQVFTISSGDGPKTIYAAFRDLANRTSEVVNATIIRDSTPPLGSLAINGGDEYTNESNVTLTLQVYDVGGAAEMLLSNKDGFPGAEWTPYQPTSKWDLLPGNGQRKVLARLRDQLGRESPLFGDTIYLDTVPPTVKVTVDGGASYTRDVFVEVSLRATENYQVEMMQLSTDPLFGGADWQSFKNTTVLRLPEGDGLRVLHVRLRDAAGNVGPPGNGSITLDTQPPTAEISPLPAQVPGRVFTVNWTGIDQTSGIRWYDVQSRDGDGPWTNWLTGTGLTGVNFSGREGHAYTFRVRALDNAGNEAAFPDTGSSPVYVQPRALPSLAFSSPKENATLKGDFEFRGTAGHPDAARRVVSVRVRFDDGGWREADGTARWSYSIDTNELGFGPHVIHAQAYDGESYSPEVSRRFYVDNSMAAPVSQQTCLWAAVLVLIPIVAAPAAYYYLKNALAKASRPASSPGPAQGPARSARPPIVFEYEEEADAKTGSEPAAMDPEPDAGTVTRTAEAAPTAAEPEAVSGPVAEEEAGEVPPPPVVVDHDADVVPAPVESEKVLDVESVGAEGDAGGTAEPSEQAASIPPAWAGRPEETEAPPALEPEAPAPAGPEDTGTDPRMRIMKALMTMPRGLPMSLLGIPMNELAGMILAAERGTAPDGRPVVKLKDRWFFSDERDLKRFMEEYKK